jgi:hypothetical protein
MPLEELTIGEDLTYQEYPVKILDTLEKVTRNNRYRMCKVQWSNHTEEEATWEKEDQLKTEFQNLELNSKFCCGAQFIFGPNNFCSTFHISWDFFCSQPTSAQASPLEGPSPSSRRRTAIAHSTGRRAIRRCRPCYPTRE